MDYLRGKIIAIEGTISSGKSTFCENLHTLLTDMGIESVIFPEEVNYSFLKLYTKNPQKYGLSFQIACFLGKLEMMRKASEAKKEGKCVIIDRSIQGDRIFAKLMKQQGLMNEEEYDVYLDYNKQKVKELPDMYIYLRVTLRESINRIKLRGRDGEDNYTINYLAGLHREYKDTMKALKTEQRVLFVDWDDSKVFTTENEKKIHIINILNKLKLV